MVTDIEIYQSAKVLFEQRGLKGASDYALNRIEELRELGDTEGADTWRRIRVALVDVSD